MGHSRHFRTRRTVSHGMKTLSLFLAGLLAVAIAVGIGFVAALVFVLAMNAILPPFRPEDDETLRELIPAGLAYATWAGTTAFVLFAAWRRFRSRYGAASRDIPER